MTKEQKISCFTDMLKNCPEIMTPKSVFKLTHLGRNKVYELLKTGELRSFPYQGGYIIAKEDLINYLAEHSDDKPRKYFSIKKENVNDNNE